MSLRWSPSWLKVNTQSLNVRMLPIKALLCSDFLSDPYFSKIMLWSYVLLAESSAYGFESRPWPCYLLSLSKTLYYCFSSPGSINGYLRWKRWSVCLISPVVAKKGCTKWAVYYPEKNNRNVAPINNVKCIGTYWHYVKCVTYKRNIIINVTT